MLHYPEKIIFKTSDQDVTFIKTIVYESFIKLYDIIAKLKEVAVPDKMRQNLVSKEHNTRRCTDIVRILDPACIVMNLHGNTKETIIKELVYILAENGKISDKQVVFDQVMNREKVMSTGMQNGLAIPHARTNGVDHVELAVGIHRKGVDFASLDDKPSKIFIMLLSSTQENDPHIQVLAEISAFLHNTDSIKKLLSCRTREDVWSFFQ